MTNLLKMFLNHDVKGPNIPTYHRNLRSGECSPFSIWDKVFKNGPRKIFKGVFHKFYLVHS